MDLEWGKVKAVQFLYSQNITFNQMVEGLSVLYGRKVSDFYSLLWYDVWKMYNFVCSELEQIGKLESEQLSSELTLKEKIAYEDLQQFGYLGTLHGLAGGDILKMDDIAGKPYRFIFQILRYQKAQSEAQKKLIKMNGQ